MIYLGGSGPRPEGRKETRRKMEQAERLKAMAETMEEMARYGYATASRWAAEGRWAEAADSARAATEDADIARSMRGRAAGCDEAEQGN